MVMQTRKVLTLDRPRKVKFLEEQLPQLEADQVMISSVLSTLKHGTEMLAYRGESPFLHKKMDPQSRLFIDNSQEAQESFYPLHLGNITVGVVEQIGSQVDSFKVGDTVFGWLPVANYHVVGSTRLRLLGKLSPQQALCVDPASFALGAVLDGGIRYRDKVLILGLGAIGLLAIQYCKLHGAKVYAGSSFALRRQLAREYGADFVFNSQELDDLGYEINQLTSGGVDVALECAGSYPKLHQGIRATRQCGKVVCVGFYSGEAKGLNLGEEFFHNRLSLIASLPAWRWNNPVRGDKPLYAQDLQDLVIQDLQDHRLKIAGLLTPTFSFTDAIAAVETIAKKPEEVVKVLIKY